jgi:succinate dehydrogenase / fumarate reductase flavoprotein subunit
LFNLLTVSEAVTLAAIERKESRGAHFREDFQAKDKTWGQFILVVQKSANGEMQIAREPLPPLPPELQQVVEEMK